jgi:ethanolamine transporter EutH
MKRNVIVFGLIAGAIVSAWMFGSIAWCYPSGNFEGNMWLGYASMLLAFSLVFVGVKNYRDKYNNGVISFGKAFQLGLLITLVASTVYVVVWLVYFYVFIPDFMDKYSAYMIHKLQTSGGTAAEIKSQIDMMLNMKEKYRNPLFVIIFTYREILPVGLLVTIVSALILKRRSDNESMVTA